MGAGLGGRGTGLNRHPPSKGSLYNGIRKRNVVMLLTVEWTESV